MAADGRERMVRHALDNDAVPHRFRYFSGAVVSGLFPPD